MFLLLALGVLLLFAYLYFQDWQQHRRMRQWSELARLRQARAQATAQPAAPRPPLIRERTRQPASTPPGAEAPARSAALSEESQPPAGSTSIAQSKRGRLEICAHDPACEVFVDGAFIGNAPARLTLPEGVHVVEVKHPGGSEYRREIFVSQAADQRVQAVLEPSRAI